AARAALPDDRSEGSWRSLAGQSDPLARLLRFARHAGVGLPRALGAMSDVATYEIAVRALCEFTAKQGDLDLRFTPSPTALEGIAGHALIAARRGEQYESEIRLEGEYGALRVRGRADGYDAERNQLEEFKTY